MRHATDPAELHQVAANLGRGMAEGRVSWGDMQTACAQLAHLHTRSRPSGLAVRMCWTARDTAQAHADALWHAEDKLRAAVRPLIAARAAKAAVEEAAGEFADTLTWPRVFTILQDEANRARFRSRWR